MVSEGLETHLRRMEIPSEDGSGGPCARLRKPVNPELRELSSIKYVESRVTEDNLRNALVKFLNDEIDETIDAASVSRGMTRMWQMDIGDI